MFQVFDVMTRPEDGPPRVEALRDAMAEVGVAAFLVPRSDAHRGENVAPSDERLAWLTGFTGSAGHAVVTELRAAVFVDGRYTLQVRSQVDQVTFETMGIPKDKLSDWLKDALPGGGAVGFDPWLHTTGEIEKLEKALDGAPIALHPVANLVDEVWEDRPPPPAERLDINPIEIAGEDHAAKRARIAETLDGATAAILTLPDSIAWLLNIRGSDIARTPVARAFAILKPDGSVDLALEDPSVVDTAITAHLGSAVRVIPKAQFLEEVAALSGQVVVDKDTCPVAVVKALKTAPKWKRDPCILPKAQKNSAELAGARAAQLRDATAMCAFLAWLDRTAPEGGLTEIDIAETLEGFRRSNNALRDISFETISGAGPNGAIVHYRVNRKTNRNVRPGELLLVDSGGQYRDGTTDITRTVAVGTPDPAAIRPFTLVLKGMIAMSRLSWPPGLAGRDLDTVARSALWAAGYDYDHGTGHGVGSYLGVHEGPANLSRRSQEPLLPGMILSNEPGYYREGAFGIRIENLLAVREPAVPQDGEREMLSFETLTHVPIDRRLIDIDLLGPSNREWLDRYHARVREEQIDLVPEGVRQWLVDATAPL